MKGLRWRIVVVTATIAFAIYLLIPTFLRFRYGIFIPKVAKAEDPWYTHVLPSEVLKLGLDLMGGLHLVLGIDFDEVHKDAMTKVRNQLRDVLKEEKIEGVEVETASNNRVAIHYTSDDQWKAIDKVIGKRLNTMVDYDSQSGHTAYLRLNPLHEKEVRDRAIDQSLETLRNRIDEFGIAEPIIQRQGDEKILVQFPGVKETGRLKEIIARTAKLSFQIVKVSPELPNGNPSYAQLQSWVKDFQDKNKIKPDPTQPISIFTKRLNEGLKDKIPANTEILFHKEVNVNTRQTEYSPYLLEKDALVTGEDLQDAYYGFDQQENHPIVNFHLTPIGATKFEKATGEHVGQLMAIVLDNNIHSAPRIKQRIGGGRAMIEMSGANRTDQEALNDAKDTALVLRSGALPARLEFLEERTVGPSLGSDAIRSGTLSLAAGLALVFIFMFIYYRGSGGVADFALFLNGLFVLAAMAAFEGTLTLPGLAGLTLTLGMAVDANVLIFEHMREELRLGRTVTMSIMEGYKRALSAIIDSHVTTVIAAVVLLSFGYGPIRGFAVTLLIGLVASLYTSVFVTRMVFDLFVVSKQRERISL